MEVAKAKPELWIGLVELKPLDRKAYGAAGAFTNIVTWTCNAGGFRQKCETIALTLNMYVADIEAAEPLAKRTEERTVSEAIEEMILRAEANPNAIIYGTFHRYPFDQT